MRKFTILLFSYSVFFHPTFRILNYIIPYCSGVNVIVAGGSISEIALHFIEKYGMLAIRVHSKYELRRLCKSVGATALVRVAPPMPAELGYVLVYFRRALLLSVHVTIPLLL